ncbi:MAG: MFS transporter, partial [Bacteroidota bacterium]
VGLLTYKKLKNPETQNNQPLKDYLNRAVYNLIKPQVVVIFILTLFAFIILYGVLLAYLPFLLANSFNATSVIIGAVISVLSFSTAIAASQLGKLSRKYTTKQILKIGFLFYFVGIISIPFVNNIWLLIIPIILYGIGQGVNIPTIYSTVASLAPMNQRGVFMSVNGTILRLGQTTGPLLMGSLYAFMGIDSIFYAGAFIAFLGFILIIWIVNPEKEIRKR